MLGLASGFALLAITSYRRVSPFWLKALLMASGLLLIIRYIMTMPLKEQISLYQSMGSWAVFGAGSVAMTLGKWQAVSSIGLTMPALFAVDQLIRHPAMTPKKLLRWYLLFLLVDGIAILTAMVWVWSLFVHWALLIGLTFGFVGACVLLARKIPSAPIRRALVGLALSYGYLGVGFLMDFRGWWNDTLLLSSEMAALLALWYAYETSARLQQTT